MKPLILACAFGLLALFAGPGPAEAQDLPALFNVTGVASDDVLNVRAAPTTGADIVGALAHDATWIEVVAREGDWGLVNIGEGSGWASLRFLQQIPDSTLPEHPRLSCFGTEPFWGLDVTQGQSAVLSTPDGLDRVFTVGMLRAASGRFSPFAMSGSAGGGTMTLVTSPRSCNDGMSDREFGLDATLVTTGSEPLILSGCCRLLP